MVRVTCRKCHQKDEKGQCATVGGSVAVIALLSVAAVWVVVILQDTAVTSKYINGNITAIEHNATRVRNYLRTMHGMFEFMHLHIHNHMKDIEGWQQDLERFAKWPSDKLGVMK